MFSLHPVRNPVHHCFNFFTTVSNSFGMHCFLLTGTQLLGLAQMFSSSCIYLWITSIKFYHLIDAVSWVLLYLQVGCFSLHHFTVNARDFQMLHTRLLENFYIWSWKLYLKFTQTNTAQFLLMTMQCKLQVSNESKSLEIYSSTHLYLRGNIKDSRALQASLSLWKLAEWKRTLFSVSTAQNKLSTFWIPLKTLKKTKTKQNL